MTQYCPYASRPTTSAVWPTIRTKTKSKTVAFPARQLVFPDTLTQGGGGGGVTEGVAVRLGRDVTEAVEVRHERAA